MSHRLFYVSDTNPNDTTGGGGCLCSPERQVDCTPPFVIFPGNDMENISSPHVVGCQKCIDAASAALKGEILSAGESNVVIEATAEEEDLELAVSPLVDDLAMSPLVDIVKHLPSPVRDEEDVPEV